MFFGKCSTPNHQLTLHEARIPWDTSCVYLGITLKTGAIFNCSDTETTKKFYRSLNSIIRIEGRSDDMVMLRLLETHFLPILTYAIEVIDVTNRDERRQLRVAYNSVYRKMFGCSYRESVTLLQHSLGRLTWEKLIEKRKLNAISRLRQHSANPIIQFFCHQ